MNVRHKDIIIVNFTVEICLYKFSNYIKM